MQNKANFQKSQMFITSMKTTNYNEKMKMDTWSKRTQSNPTRSELACTELCRSVKPFPQNPHKKTPRRILSPQGYKNPSTILRLWLLRQEGLQCHYCSRRLLSDSSTISSSFFVPLLVFRGIFTATPSRPSSPATSGWLGLSWKLRLK